MTRAVGSLLIQLLQAPGLDLSSFSEETSLVAERDLEIEVLREIARKDW
jgi:hypothetical protein